MKHLKFRFIIFALFCVSIISCGEQSAQDTAGSGSSVLVISSSFEDVNGATGVNAPTGNYPFGTNYAAFWDSHALGTEVISDCEGRGAYDGTYYWHMQFMIDYLDPCLGTTTNSINTHSNIGGDFAYPQGGQNRVNLEEAITSNTLVVRFYFRTTGDWGSTNSTDGGGGLKFIRVFGNGGNGDPAAALLKMRNDGDSPDPTWVIFNTQGTSYETINNAHFAGVDVQDGQWHSIAAKVVRNNDTGAADNISFTFWIDDWSMSGAGHTQVITSQLFGDGFRTIELFANWSADYAENPMGLDIDKLEVWNGDPE